MRKHYLDNIRWIVGVLVIIYHVFYMYNAQGILGGLGPITDLKIQYYDLFMYIVYPWLMPILFIVSGISSRYYLENRSDKEFIRNRTRKLLVPSTVGLFIFHFMSAGKEKQILDTPVTTLATISHSKTQITVNLRVSTGRGKICLLTILDLFIIVAILQRIIGLHDRWILKKPLREFLSFYLALGIIGLRRIIHSISMRTIYRISQLHAMFFWSYIHRIFQLMTDK